jgi:myxalamid-type polyketide synthase MxaE and MxaD
VEARIIGAQEPDGFRQNVRLIDEESGLQIRLDGVVLRRPASAPSGSSGVINEAFHTIDWVAAPTAPRSQAARPRSLASPGRSANPGTPGTWIVVCDASGVGESVASRLEAAGANVARVMAGGPEHAAVDAVRRLRSNGLLELRGVVHCGAIDGRSGHGPQRDTEDLASAAASVVAGAAAVVRELASCDWRQAPRVWFVTSGACGPDAIDVPGAAQATLWGLGRVLAEEHPELWGGLVDVDAQAQAAEAAGQLVEEVLRGDANDQVAYRRGQRFAPRLTRCALPAAPIALGGGGAYVITGGLGDVGLAVAGWAVDRGARHLLLLGRRGLAPEASPADRKTARRAAAVAGLRVRGCEVDIAAVDVADRDALARTLVSYRAKTGVPIRGVFHCAAIVEDRLIRDLDTDSLHRVLRPKMRGALALADVLSGDPLDFFVLFSSIGALLGQPGQASYAAANAFLDALAHARRGQGLPGLAIDWGVWRGLGVAAAPGAAATIGALEGRGIRSFDSAEGCEALGIALSQDGAQVAFVPADWRSYERADPGGARRPLLGAVCTGGGEVEAQSAEAPADSVLRRIEHADPDERLKLLEAHLRQQLADVLKAPLSKIDPNRPLGTLGLESLLSLELRTRLERSLGVQLSATMVWNHPTVCALARYLAGRLNIAGDSVPAAVAATPVPEAQAAPPIDELSEEQALQALLEGR